MPTLLRFALLVALAAPGFAQGQIRDIGSIDVDLINKSIPVRVSANVPELNTLALVAFSTHGRYRLVASAYTFDIRFTQSGPAQVQLDITKGLMATPVTAEMVTGDTLRHALLRAADLAVEKTNGLGLRGYFTARLAFIGEKTGKKEVYISDLFFSPGQVKKLTGDGSPALTPRWSPDGTKLLYTSFYKSGFPDIFQIDLSSNNRTTFVSFRGLNSGARFSPNGLQVAMVLSGEGTPEIYVSNAQGRQVSRKTRSDLVKASPCWSPDGGRLVFAMEPGPQLYVMSAGGGGLRRLSTNSGYAAEPDWSRANPNKIAFTVGVGRPTHYQIAVYDESKNSAEVASKADFDGIEPCWLADGRHVVYTARDRRGTTVLCILDTETHKSTMISQGFGANAQMGSVWTP